MALLRTFFLAWPVRVVAVVAIFVVVVVGGGCCLLLLLGMKLLFHVVLDVFRT